MNAKGFKWFANVAEKISHLQTRRNQLIDIHDLYSATLPNSPTGRPLLRLGVWVVQDRNGESDNRWHCHTGTTATLMNSYPSSA